MADGGLHFIDVTVRPCQYIENVISGSWSSLQEGLKTGNGKVIHAFKVIGENHLVAVLNGGIEAAVSSLNAAHGENVEIKCIPLRTYEGFAKSVLGVEDSLTQLVPVKLGSNKCIYMLHFVVEYRGMTATELVGTWKREAEKALGLRYSGDLELSLYKVVAQREVIGFITAPDGEIMDDISFTLPLMREIGDQVHITTRVLQPLH